MGRRSASAATGPSGRERCSRQDRRTISALANEGSFDAGPESPNANAMNKQQSQTPPYTIVWKFPKARSNCQLAARATAFAALSPSDPMPCSAPDLINTARRYVRVSAGFAARPRAGLTRCFWTDARGLQMAPQHLLQALTTARNPSAIESGPNSMSSAPHQLTLL